MSGLRTQPGRAWPSQSRRWALRPGPSPASRHQPAGLQPKTGNVSGRRREFNAFPLRHESHQCSVAGRFLLPEQGCSWFSVLGSRSRAVFELRGGSGLLSEHGLGHRWAPGRSRHGLQDSRPLRGPLVTCRVLLPMMCTAQALDACESRL